METTTFLTYFSSFKTQRNNHPIKNDLLFTGKRTARVFSNFAQMFSRLNSLNPESFAIKCPTRFRDNSHYLKRSALVHHCYDNSVLLRNQHKYKI